MNANQFSRKNLNQTNRVLAAGATGVFGAAILFVAGCAMCCGPYDYHYPNHGGAVQRSDPTWGRVGSIYSDPGPFGGPDANYNLAPHDEGRNMPEDDTGSGLELPDDFGDESQGGGLNGSDILPPPDQEDPRPGPDDTTSVRRLRNQSKRPVRRWR